MSALQGRKYETVVRLMVDGTYGLTPVAGVPFAQVAATMRRTDIYVFELKALNLTNWVELQDGYYVVVWSTSDTSHLGELFFYLESSGAIPFNTVEGKFSIEPTPLAVLAAPDRCIISGNVINLGGEPGTESWVTFRLAKTPSVASTSVVEGKILRTYPDVFGNFSISLLRSKKVIVEIPQSGLKHTITVPDQETANLVDVLPPIID